jgi:hypothetical protein
VVKEVADVESLHGPTASEDLFLNACETIKELELPWTKLKRVKIGTSSVIGRKTDLMGRFRREMDKQNTKFYMELHCIIHQQLL